MTRGDLMALKQLAQAASSDIVSKPPMHWKAADYVFYRIARDRLLELIDLVLEAEAEAYSAETGGTTSEGGASRSIPR